MNSFKIQGRHIGSTGTRVVRVSEEHDVKICRPTIWGNPYFIGRDGERDEVIAKYKKYILSSPELLARLPELVGKRLACHCYPKACHGDVLVELIEERFGNVGVKDGQ